MKLQEISLYIQNLELELLHHDWTEDPQSIDELLSADFEEIDANGTVHSRHDVVQWLMQKDKMQRWSLLNFRIKLLTDECVLAIYNACKKTIRVMITVDQSGHPFGKFKIIGGK